MADLTTLIARAQSGDLDAYSELVGRFQDMAVGYAYSVLGDFHLAEDAAQEAFIEAYLNLSQLREPAAFSGWFRQIVFRRCNRITRRKRIPNVPLDAEYEIASPEPGPDELVERQEVKSAVRQAIQALPDHEREATALFYIDGYSQNEIGDFLEVPAKTIKSRLHTARNRLRERMMGMVEEHLHDQRPSRDEAFAVRVIDDLTKMTDPEIRSLLYKVNARDMAIVLKGTSRELRERVYANASEYMEAFIKEEMAFSVNADQKDIDAERDRIIKIAQELVEGEQRQPGEEYLSLMSKLENQLQGVSFSDLSFEDITEVFFTIAEIAKRNGILALEKAAEFPTEDLFRQALRLVVDGHEPEAIQKVLDTRLETLIHDRKTRYRMIIEGVSTMRAEKTAGIGVGLRLRNLYMSNFYAPDRKGKDAGLNPSVQKLKTRLEKTPFSQLSLEEITEVMMDIAIIARQETTEALGEIAALIDDPLLVEGLNMAVYGRAGGKTFPFLFPELIRRMLEIKMHTLLQQQETRYRMIIEGMRSIQSGDHPNVIRQKLRNFYTP